MPSGFVTPALVRGSILWRRCLGEMASGRPGEVLSTVMRHHQKYFSVTEPGGKLAPEFVAVMNIESDPEGFVREIYSSMFLHPQMVLNDVQTLLMERSAPSASTR